MKIYKSKKAEERILSTYDALIREWNVPVTQTDVETRYGTTHINICGKHDGAPLVLFHGVGDDSALMWIYNAAKLSEEFRVYAIDTIGGPGKSRPNENYNKSFDDALWIDDVLSTLGLDKVNIAGVSHGGYLAQYYCHKRPDKVIKAVCMASSVAAGKSGNPLITMMKIFFPEALFPTDNNIRKLIRKLSGENVGAFTDNQLIMEHFTYLLRGYNNMAMGNHKVTTFTEEQIDVIRDKCLFLVGESDPFMTLGGKEMLNSNRMSAKFFPKVGHGINHEIADEINSILIDYFKESIIV